MVTRIGGFGCEIVQWELEVEVFGRCWVGESMLLYSLGFLGWPPLWVGEHE